MAKIKIPKSPDEITNDWLTDVQRGSGKLKDAVVVNHSIKPLAIGIGSANIKRINLEYDFPEDGALSSMIAKFVSVRKKPHADKLKDFSDREIKFYQHLDSNSGISTPQCFYGEIDKESGEPIPPGQNWLSALPDIRSYPWSRPLSSPGLRGHCRVGPRGKPLP